MNAQAIGQLGVGLLGVWAFIVALGFFGSASWGVFSFDQPGAYKVFLFAWVLPFVLTLGLSYLLVVHAAAVTRRLLSPLQVEPAGPPTDVGRVLVGLVGIWVVLGSLPGLLLPIGLPRSLWLGTAATVVRAGVGLLMVLRPGIFLSIWASRSTAA